LGQGFSINQFVCKQYDISLVSTSFWFVCERILFLQNKSKTQPAFRKDRRGEDRTHGMLFARGYNDKLLLRERQLETWLRYLSDDPRRLQENGLTELAKPSGTRMEACARGQLLILPPWEHHNEQITISRNQCLMLNDLARRICKND